MPSNDPAFRRLAKRSGREAGCWAYIDAQALLSAGWTPGGPLPFYRTWGRRKSRNRGTVMVALYPER